MDSSNSYIILNNAFGFSVGNPVYRSFLNEIYFDDLILNKKCINKVYKSEKPIYIKLLLL